VRIERKDMEYLVFLLYCKERQKESREKRTKEKELAQNHLFLFYWNEFCDQLPKRFDSIRLFEAFFASRFDTPRKRKLGQVGRGPNNAETKTSPDSRLTLDRSKFPIG
jgi:hypothetical protein